MNPETPYIAIHYSTVKQNIIHMATMAKNNGCNLRPHIKTHKIPEIAKMQIDAGAIGITVAKIGEAKVMAAHGIEDIFIAYPIIGEDKIQHLIALNQKIRLIVGVDSLSGAKALSKAFEKVNQAIEVRLEIDTGMGRTGVPYDEAFDFARKINCYMGLKLTGIFTFKGLVYQGKATLDWEKAGLEEGKMMVELADQLRYSGINIEDVSVGSTPTAASAARVDGVTEVRPGTYVFNDTMLVNMGICQWDACAASVVTTVVSAHQPDKVIVDGGNKTFSTDAPLNVFPHYLQGYGKIIGRDGVFLEKLSEEHGTIRLEKEEGSLKVGDQLAIIPNHICTTINLHDKVYFIEDSGQMRAVKVEGRGKVY